MLSCLFGGSGYCVYCGDCTFTKTKITMFIPYTLRASYWRLCETRPDSNRIYDAMIQATFDNMKCVRSRKICDLFISLKHLGIGTSEVEYSVKRTCSILSDRYKRITKMKIMRVKIGDAFKNLKDDRIIETVKRGKGVRRLYTVVYVYNI